MKTEPTMSDFLSLSHKITLETNFDVFLQYSGHVNRFSIQICKKESTDFERVLTFEWLNVDELHLKNWIELNNFYNEHKTK